MANNRRDADDELAFRLQLLELGVDEGDAGDSATDNTDSAAHTISAHYVRHIDGAHASNARRTVNPRPRPQTRLTCVVYLEDKSPNDVMAAPCGHHHFCIDCLPNAIRLVLNDSGHPLRCCDHQNITPAHVRPYLAPVLAEAYAERYGELRTPLASRIYCWRPECASFIPRDMIEGRNAVCLTCGRRTCTTCRAAAHTGDCASDDADDTQDVLRMAEDRGWQRCHNCRQMVAVGTGCNEITCICGARFCYVCGMRWKTCDCPHSAEGRLFNVPRGQDHPRDPRHRLYQPLSTAPNTDRRTEHIPPTADRTRNTNSGGANRQDQASSSNHRRQEFARQEPIRQEPTRQEPTRQQSTRQEPAHQESTRQKLARQEPTPQEPMRQQSTRQVSTRQEFARREPTRKVSTRQEPTEPTPPPADEPKLPQRKTSRMQLERRPTSRVPRRVCPSYSYVVRKRETPSSTSKRTPSTVKHTPSTYFYKGEGDPPPRPTLRQRLFACVLAVVLS